jgi:hypothetical protein
MTLYHVTTWDRAQQIVNAQRMYPGSNGLFGAGIYLAETSAAAFEKARCDGRPGTTVLAVVVNLGTALVVEGAWYSCNSTAVSSRGCRSVKGRSHSGAKWEFVIYDDSPIISIRFA